MQNVKNKETVKVVFGKILLVIALSSYNLLKRLMTD